MATSEFWQRVSETVSPTPENSEGPAGDSTRKSRGMAKLWMVLDALTVLVAAVVATVWELHTGPWAGAKGFWYGTLIYGRSKGILLALLFEFTLAIIAISRRLHLYNPERLGSFLHEQRLSVQACLTSGLLLTATLYLLQAQDIPRRIVVVTLVLVTIALSLRRLIYRLLLYRNFSRGIGTRNVLIVGTGPEAHALRHHLDNIRHLGYTFIGFVDLPGFGVRMNEDSGDLAATLETLFVHARKQFVDEIFFTAPCEHGTVQSVLERARAHGVDLRVIPAMYDGLAWNSPIEYIGQFPTIPLHRGHVPEAGLLVKRVMDVVFSSLVVAMISPLLLAIAVAIKLDSPGPIFYLSDRIGKKGRIFRCIKFRTMVADAETRRADLAHLNERDGVLFKISNDPRVTRLGYYLRKYSLDELPQFFNVLRGEMSVVGPRPPLASEVKKYQLNHLRRLDVTPGVTGLWQVQGRRDPSFDSYVSLDVTYIENWSIWLDIKIIIRTIGVVFSGTGS
jgi:exopolysaccharide biosynthesis polyprenyl glycosylphosphotransferase